MSSRVALGILMGVIAGLSAREASANGFRLADQDAFATARGEAFVATADNASAIYYNPAGLTRLQGNNVRAGIYGIYLDPTFTPPPPGNTNTFHIKNKFAAVPQFFYAFAPRDLPWSFGLGVYSPYGLGVSWPQDTGFRAVAIEGSLVYVRLNPAVALKLAPGLSIGAGVMVDYANISLEQGLLASRLPFTNFFRFKGDGWGLGYNLGLLWQPHRKISFGATFRSSTTITMKGRTEFEQQPLPGLFPATHRSAEADFHFPLTAVFGVSVRPTSKWNLEFDADYTDWSSLGTVTIRQAPPPWPVQKNVPVKLEWQPSWLYEFGATRYFDGGWHVSAGYVYNQNSVPDTYYSPLAADLDRHFFSAGAGYRGRTFSFDFAYQFGYGPARTVSGSTPSSTPGQFAGQTADGTYDFISHAVMVTVGIHF